MPSRMVINTESTVGYNNKLKRVSPSMKLGVNYDVNVDSGEVGIKNNLGVSKVKLPHVQHVVSHVRKAAEKLESLSVEAQPEKEDVPKKSTHTKHELI